jgi:hypothetical protein
LKWPYGYSGLVFLISYALSAVSSKRSQPMRGTRACLLVLGLLLGSAGTAARGQPVGWWGLQGKVIGGVGLVAEGPIASGLQGTVGAGWLLLLVDGFAGVTTHTRTPLDFYGRVHLTWAAEINLPGGGSSSEDENLLLGLEPGVRLQFGRLLLEGGLLLFFDTETVRGGRTGVPRNRLRTIVAPNVGLLVRLGRIRD